MAQRLVECERTICAPPDIIWQYVGDFWSDWHPAIKTSKRVVLDAGEETRVFIGSDGNEYREQLTYFSNSDHCFQYSLTAGIEGVTAYGGSVELHGKGEASTVVKWAARMDVPEHAADAIAIGTKSIFEQGLDWLANRELPIPKRPIAKASSVSAAPTRRETIETQPVLSLLRAQQKETNTLVLFLHGIGGNAENWLPQLNGLGGNFNLAALDIRGYGKSALGDAASTIEDHCNDILKAMRHSGARKLILVGLSMGSWIATSFAMRYPKSLAGLVLAGGCTGMSEASSDVREGFRKSRSQPLLSGKTPADMAPEVLDTICGPQAPLEARKALQDSMASIPTATYLDALNCFCKPTEKFDFSRINCPVLMVTGEHDRLAPPAEIRAVSKRICADMQMQDMRFEVLENAGHVCNLEAPDAFNTLLADFLNRFANAKIPAAMVRTSKKREVKKNRILEASLLEFCQNGFDGVSMDAIAKAASVSKPTLYQYFGDKQGLFTAVLEQGRAHILTPLLQPKGSLVDQLWEFSWTYADFVLRPEMLSLARLILGEASRRPQSAEAYHRAGPGKALEGLISFLSARAAQGSLVIEDAELAAQDLWSLILSGPRDHHLHFVAASIDHDDLLRVIAHGLQVFLKVYSANVDADLAELAAKAEARKIASV